MRKVLTAGLAALTLAGGVAATAAPAEAAPYGYYHGGYGHGYGRGWGGAALAAGVLGLAAGAAIAGSHPYYYGGPYYAGPYYGPGYYGYGACIGQRRIWDPYVGGYVVRSFRYAC